MAELSLIIGVVGIIISILLFLSPIKTFILIVEAKSTKGFESLPYICALLNTALWTYYGVEKTDGRLVAIVNGIGAFFEFVYVALFLRYTPMRAKTATIAAGLDLGVLAGAILITRLMLHGETRIDVIGFLCAGLNIIMYASPLAAIGRVVTSKSVEYMPFLLSFFMLMNGGIWTLYAILVKDLYLGISNGIGSSLGLVQLVIYAIYKKYPNSSQIISEDLDDQSQREPLRPSSSCSQIIFEDSDPSSSCSQITFEDSDDQSQHQPLTLARRNTS